MALTFNNNHITYYHMDVQQSTPLAHTYFTSPDYLAVQDRIHTTFIFPETINPTEPPVYHYTKFFNGVVDYTPLDIPCDRHVAVISFANTALPYVLTAYLALMSILSLQCHGVHNVRCNYTSI